MLNNIYGSIKKCLKKVFPYTVYKSSILLGSYFCYDTPGALQDTIIRDLELSTSQYVLFYSLYSWPNVILCFFGGLLLDNVFGICWGTIIFSVIVTIGQVN